MDIARLNVSYIGKPVSGFQGDMRRFQELESQVGKPLPAAYVEYLLTHDGGGPKVSRFFPQGRTHHMLAFEICRFHSLSDGPQCIFGTLKDWKWTLGKGMLPIANDGGNNQIYLNLNEEVPSVWFWAHDTYNPDGGDDDGHENFVWEGEVTEDAEGEYEEGEDEERVPRFKIANSFEEFIDGLTIPTDDD